MSSEQIDADVAERLWNIVESYVAKQEYVRQFLRQMVTMVEESSELEVLVHSTRHRLKDAQHLYEKLVRKWRQCEKDGTEFQITEENILETVNDLAGIRILHLHTEQFREINEKLIALFDEYMIGIVEGPTAKTWDIEYKEKFRAMGVSTEDNERMYTSVHYVIESNSKTKITCEIQVRTLMEEVWGEVDHSINYPEPVDSVACREQIRALARVTSSATRLVDSIIASVEDWKKH